MQFYYKYLRFVLNAIFINLNSTEDILINYRIQKEKVTLAELPSTNTNLDAWHILINKADSYKII